MFIPQPTPTPFTAANNGFVNVEGEKMSKAIGNIKLVHDLKKQYRGEVLRLTLLSAHYRQPLNWTDSTIIEAGNLMKKFKALAKTYNLEDKISDELDTLAVELI